MLIPYDVVSNSNNCFKSKDIHMQNMIQRSCLDFTTVPRDLNGKCHHLRLLPRNTMARLYKIYMTTAACTSVDDNSIYRSLENFMFE